MFLLVDILLARTTYTTTNAEELLQPPEMAREAGKRSSLIMTNPVDRRVDLFYFFPNSLIYGLEVSAPAMLLWGTRCMELESVFSGRASPASPSQRE